MMSQASGDPISDEVLDQIRDLVARINANPPGDGDLPSLVIGIGDERWWLDDEGHLLLTDLANRLAGESVSSSGLSPKAARDRLIRACSESISVGIDAAIRSLEDYLTSPLREWTVFKPHRISFPGEVFEVGRCRMQRGLPPAFDGVVGVHDDFPAFSIATTVLAHDSDAAMVLAAEAMSDALAVMQLASSEHRAYLGRPVALLADDGSVEHTPSAFPDLYLQPIVRGPGELKPSAKALSDAAAKSSDERTDWERRVLAAARWLSKGIASNWPSDSLVSYMVALEALFVRDRSVRGKGEAIARGISGLFRFRDTTTEQQEEWLRDLYSKRNDAVHEGRSYSQDYHVDRLAVLTLGALRWAAAHLSAPHGVRPMACTTFDEAHDANHA